MAYQSLYRKYRSRDFADLVGQRHVTQTLANAIASGRVSHAYLFCGPRGTGKTSTARVLAKSLNCQHGPTAEPCDACPYCLSIRQGSAMDVIEIDAASNRNIDDMRQLREQVNYPPVELRYKFYIVDEVHQLTRDAFNAFLKTLEEPPPHVIFVLCTTDPHQLPATILSRCQRFDFHRITQDDIVERLRWIVAQEQWTVEEEALFLLARSANGGLRDALSLLDQAASYAGATISAAHVRDILGGIDLDLLIDFSAKLISRDANGLFHLIDRIMAEGKDVPQLVAELILHWRNLLRVSIGGTEALLEYSPEQREQVKAQSSQLEQQEIMRAITLWCEAENDLRWNSQQRLLVELYSLRVMNVEPPAVPAIAPAAQSSVQRSTVPVSPEPARSFTQDTPRTPTTTAAPSQPDTTLTLEQLKSKWPNFLAMLKTTPVGQKLFDRVIDKSWPVEMQGSRLKLATTSGFVRTMVIEQPKVREALETYLQSFFKVPIILEIVLAADTCDAATPAAETTPPSIVAETPATLTVAPSAPLATTPEHSTRDEIGARMKAVFPASVELTE